MSGALSVLVPRLLIASLLFSLAAGCGAAGSASMAKRASPVVGGDLDSGHDAVVLVVDPTGALCTGVLVADRVVLTAAHCIAGGDPSNFQVLGGSQPLDSAAFAAGVSELHISPDFDGATSAHDVALLVLDQSIPPAPMPWMLGPSDAVYAPGRSFVTAGYGVSTPGGTDGGVKRRASLQIQQHDAVAFYYAGGAQNACAGDSGAPAIVAINGVETVIGTASYGDPGCADFGADMRTDANATFLSELAPQPAPVSSSPAALEEGADHGVALSGPVSAGSCSLDAIDAGTTLAASWLGMLGIATMAIQRRRRVARR